jgi:GTPase SAR1 family protein
MSKNKEKDLLFGKDFQDKYNEDDYGEMDYDEDDEEIETKSSENKKDSNDIGTLYIKELDVNSLKPEHSKDFKNGCKLVIIGAPGSGKSTIIKSIIYSKKHILAVGQVFSGTEDSNGFFGEFFPESFIYNGLDTSDLTPLENFKKRQKIARKYIEPIGGYPWALNVIDDCTYDTTFLKKAIYKEFCKNGRHFAMLHILSLQYCLDIKPEIRVNINGVFILRESRLDIRKKLYENYGGCIPTFEMFCQIMDALTTDYTALYINNMSTSNKIEDTVFYYKANPNAIPKDWKFGCKEFWQFHNERHIGNDGELF